MSPDPETKQLARLRRTWTALGHDDPLWAVLSANDKRGGRWDPAEFLATGRAEIECQLGFLAGHGLPLRRRRALDFGCGVGRLTRALGTHFDEVLGLDVSPSMIDAARRLNADAPNLRFVENPHTRLHGIDDGSIDLVYSCITLQHIPPPLAAGYVAEFLRVLAPGGVAVFQFVDGADASWRGRLYGRLSNRWLNPLRRIAWRRGAVFEMHVLAEAELGRLLEARPGLDLLAALDDDAAGPGWRSRRWYVRRESA